MPGRAEKKTGRAKKKTGRAGPEKNGRKKIPPFLRQTGILTKKSFCFYFWLCFYQKNLQFFTFGYVFIKKIILFLLLTVILSKKSTFVLLLAVILEKNQHFFTFGCDFYKKINLRFS